MIDNEKKMIVRSHSSYCDKVIRSCETQEQLKDARNILKIKITSQTNTRSNTHLVSNTNSSISLGSILFR